MRCSHYLFSSAMLHAWSCILLHGKHPQPQAMIIIKVITATTVLLLPPPLLLLLLLLPRRMWRTTAASTHAARLQQQRQGASQVQVQVHRPAQRI